MKSLATLELHVSLLFRLKGVFIYGEEVSVLAERACQVIAGVSGACIASCRAR